MKRVLINPDKCLNCRECKVAESCPQNAIFREDANDKPWVNSQQCVGCKICKAHCINDALVEEQ